MDTARKVHERIREPASFKNEGSLSGYSNKYLDPVPVEKKPWAWCHAGSWTAEYFNAAQMEKPSSAASLGLNLVLAIVRVWLEICW